MTAGFSIEAALSRLDGPPRRVISLVPSYTQSLFDLGFGASLVGITDYCTHPRGKLERLQKVGGPKSPDFAKIRKLQPDLILANQEENDREGIHMLHDAGLNVWLSFPRSVKELFDVLSDFVRLFADEEASLRLRMLETSFEWAALAAGGNRFRYFCPIWQDLSPEGQWHWITFNRDTYSSDLLDRLGAENIFSDRRRRYPLEADLDCADAESPGDRDTRYPRVPCAEVISRQPDFILVPDEPCVFDPASERILLDLLAETPAVRNNRVYRVEGRLITWCGTAIGEAAQQLPSLLDMLETGDS